MGGTKTVPPWRLMLAVGAHELQIAASAVAADRIVVTADASAFDDLPGVSVQSHR